MKTALTLELTVDCEPGMVTATKEFASWRDALPLINEFLTKFGEPDRGPQEIRITLTSAELAGTAWNGGGDYSASCVRPGK